MIIIFAKKDTSEKVILECERTDVSHYQLVLGGMYGGEWLFVDNLKGHRNFIKFNDGLKYEGYSRKQRRYCKNIITFPEI